MKKLSAILVCAVLALGSAGGAAYAAGAENGDADKGRGVFKLKCRSCHGVEAGKHKMGPSLAGVYGTKAGSTDFKRYVGLKDADFSWDSENLDGFLENPKKFLGRKTTMRVPLKDAEARRDVIAYLKTLQ